MTGPAGMPDPALGAEVSRLILAGSADGIVAIDDDGIIRVANPAAEEFFGRPTGELVGTPFGFPLAVNSLTEIDIIIPGGSPRTVAMRVATTTVEGQRFHIAALRDVTLRRQAEQELEAALAQQNIVVAVAAHELRSPLYTIRVLLDTLRSPSAALSDARRTDLLNRISDRVDRLQALVTKLLTASKIDAGAPRTPTRVPVLEVILERLGELGEKAADVTVSCAPDVTAVVDRGELSQILANYLENACTYGRPPIQVEARSRGASVEIRVSDHGPGVPDAFVPQLFERFRRAVGAHRDTEGTGLGLWIVRNLTRAAGGDAWYEPANGEGACFCLRLPRAGR